jgi:hypothetical protein
VLTAVTQMLVMAAYFVVLAPVFGVLNLLLTALLAMGINGLVSASSTIVLFLGLRLQNSTFTTLSGSVMRFARAQANSY